MLRRWSAVLILLIAAAFRIHAVTYGLSDVCLAVPEEYWQYSVSQPVSLYTWNTEPRGALQNLPAGAEPAPLVTATTSPVDRLITRLMGCAVGLLTIALILCYGRKLRSRWWWLGGLFLAVSPWFVGVDRWTERFDMAPLAVAIAALTLWAAGHLQSGWRRQLVTGIYTLAALSLLLIAPPLWWLAVILLLLQPKPLWRWAIFILVVGIIAIPALKSPELWLASTQLWDAGTTAACILAGVALALWWRPSIPTLHMRILTVLVVFTAALSLYQDRQLKQPSAAEWDLVHWLQTRIPDQSLIQFDFATWPLEKIVACPMGANIDFTPQSLGVPFFDTRDLKDPYYYVSTDSKAVAKMPYITQIGDRYWVGRGLGGKHQVDINFGDYAYLLDYEILTPSISATDVINIRIDYQFGANITPDVLAYAAYIHVTPKDDPATNWANYTDPFFEESGNTGSRRVMLDHHLRFSLPPQIPKGTYDVRFGIFNVYSGARLGDEIVLGDITVK